MSEIIDIERPSKELISSLEGLGSATASGELHKMGIRDPFIQGPTSFTGVKIYSWTSVNFTVFTYS